MVLQNEQGLRRADKVLRKRVRLFERARFYKSRTREKKERLPVR